jgi:hypothetical protein
MRLLYSRTYNLTILCSVQYELDTRHDTRHQMGFRGVPVVARIIQQQSFEIVVLRCLLCTFSFNLIYIMLHSWMVWYQSIKNLAFFVLHAPVAIV